MKQGRILVVEDDPELRQALLTTLELEGMQCLGADDGEKALSILAEAPVDMVVSDVNMPKLTGDELLCRIKSLYPHIPVLLITAYASVSQAVAAMKNGAVDYLVKPFQSDQLIRNINRVVNGVEPNDSSSPIAEELSSRQLLALALRVASSDSTVLISGESGTGKEVLARYIHRHSPRKDRPFVAINCAAIPENMLEAMLFGHEKGAFTGAYTSSPGKFEQADGGTILLDEISEMDMGLQAKLLRVLQEREVERVGGRRTIELDVRVLATTNRNLLEEVHAGRFREDLYYRLSVFPLAWLPLRQRRRDILPLANYLVHHHAEKMQLGTVILDENAEHLIEQHSWPGNVRELDNVIQRALILHTDGVIRSGDILLDMSQQNDTQCLPAAVDNDSNRLGDDLRQHEFQLIIDTLRHFRGKRKEAAEKLGISPRTLRYKMAQMREAGIDIDSMMQMA